MLLSTGLALGFASVLPVFAVGAQVLRSGPGQTSLLELFTSEGCSSCPPAEKWLEGLAEVPGLWRDFVPVAFHVDYWDGLGWPDRFASKANTFRQEAYAARWRSRSVYTPCFALNGEEWRGWGGVPGFAKSGIVTAGSLEVAAAGTNQFAITFVLPADVTGDLEATVAWLGSDLVTEIRRGENAGRRLRHSFVVLRLSTGKLWPKGVGATATLTLPPPDSHEAAKLGLAAWVSRRGDLVPLQAVGGWWP